RQGVYRRFVDTELIMQMRPGCRPCGAGVTNQLTLVVAVSLPQAFGVAALMRVQGAVAIVLCPDDGIARTFLAALEGHHTIGRGMYGGAGGCGIIDALVAAPAAMHRVLAHPEGGADARKLQGCAQEGALQAAPFEVVIAARGA